MAEGAVLPDVSSGNEAEGPGDPGAPDLSPEAGGIPGTPAPDMPDILAREACIAWLDGRLRQFLVYPPAARRRGLEGMVELEILLDRQGGARDIRILRGSGARLLDQAALDGALRCLPVEPPPGRDLVLVYRVRFVLE